MDQKPQEEQIQSDSVAAAPAESTPEVAVAEAAPSPLSDGGAALAKDLAASGRFAWLRKIYGGALTGVALGAVAIIATSYVPHLNAEAPVAQVAAVEVVHEAPQDQFATSSVSARSVYVYDVKEDKELFSKESALQLPLASITKVALMLAVAEVLQSDDLVTISASALEKGGGLYEGEVWLARDLIDYTLITSSNAGAQALAEAADAGLHAKYPEAPLGGAAVWRMNALAEELGMKETYFINATGLDESTTQAGSLGSARDIAALFAHAIRTNPKLFIGTTRSNTTLAPLNFPERTAKNTNNSLADIPGIIMGKTGTTDLAGGNLAIAFNAAPERPVIIVVLGSTESGRYEDVKKLAEAAREAIQ